MMAFSSYVRAVQKVSQEGSVDKFTCQAYRDAAHSDRQRLTGTAKIFIPIHPIHLGSKTTFIRTFETLVPWSLGGGNTALYSILYLFGKERYTV